MHVHWWRRILEMLNENLLFLLTSSWLPSNFPLFSPHRSHHLYLHFTFSFSHFPSSHSIYFPFFLTILYSSFSIRHCFRSRPGVGHRHSSGWWLHPPRHPHPLPPNHWKVTTLLYLSIKCMQRQCNSVGCCFSLLCDLVFVWLFNSACYCCLLLVYWYKYSIYNIVSNFFFFIFSEDNNGLSVEFYWNSPL